MGQYTWYVWSSVGLVLLSLGWLAIQAVLQHRRIQQHLKRAIR